MNSKKKGMHPLSVKGSKSENRWSQTRHEIFSPLPCKVIAVAPSGGGKSSLLLTFANAVFENMDYWAIFSRSHMLDPALQDLKERIRERYKQRGVDEQSTPFLFENLDSLTRVLAEQKQRVQELKDAETPVTRLPQLFVMIDDIGLEATRFPGSWTMPSPIVGTTARIWRAAPSSTSPSPNLFGSMRTSSAAIASRRRNTNPWKVKLWAPG